MFWMTPVNYLWLACLFPKDSYCSRSGWRWTYAMQILQLLIYSCLCKSNAHTTLPMNHLIFLGGRWFISLLLSLFFTLLWKMLIFHVIISYLQWNSSNGIQWFFFIDHLLVKRIYQATSFEIGFVCKFYTFRLGLRNFWIFYINSVALIFR